MSRWGPTNQAYFCLPSMPFKRMPSDESLERMCAMDWGCKSITRRISLRCALRSFSVFMRSRLWMCSLQFRADGMAGGARGGALRPATEVMGPSFAVRADGVSGASGNEHTWPATHAATSERCPTAAFPIMLIPPKLHTSSHRFSRPRRLAPRADNMTTTRHNAHGAKPSPGPTTPVPNESRGRDAPSVWPPNDVPDN